MPTNKTPFTFHIDEATLLKIRQIAKNETRSVSNLIEHLCKMCVNTYEKEQGEIEIDIE